MSNYEMNIKSKAYNDGFAAGYRYGKDSLWNEIKLAVNNPGGYTLLRDAVIGTEEHPSGFVVKVVKGESIKSCLPIDRSDIDWGDYR